jgi:hypothetical protein
MAYAQEFCRRKDIVAKCGSGCFNAQRSRSSSAGGQGVSAESVNPDPSRKLAQTLFAHGWIYLEGGNGAPWQTNINTHGVQCFGKLIPQLSATSTRGSSKVHQQNQLIAQLVPYIPIGQQVRHWSSREIQVGTVLTNDFQISDWLLGTSTSTTSLGILRQWCIEYSLLQSWCALVTQQYLRDPRTPIDDTPDRGGPVRGPVNSHWHHCLQCSG